MPRRLKATGYSPYAKCRIPAHTIHGWAILHDLQTDAARLCRAPLAIVRDPGDTSPLAEREAFKARRIVALVLRMQGVSLGTIGAMIDRDHASVKNAVENAQRSTWEVQAAEQLALKYAARDVAS